ncbi:MAG: efflux RND transporter periplasmic adaptor subunit [Candidatus Omnitrophota bacterium]
MKKITIYLLFLLTACALISGCGKAGESTAAEAETIPVKVMKVKIGDVSKSLDYVGDIKGQDEAVVYPKVSGKIIEKVKEEGEGVAKGDVIAYIDRDEVGLKFEKAPVESPLAGTVCRVYVDIGSNVTVQTPIALVADMTKAEIDLDVPEGYLSQILPGQKAVIRVDTYPQEEFMGKVVRVSPMVDLETRTAPIEILIPNEDLRLQSGTFARVELILEEHRKHPVILKEAVIGRVEPFYVYVIEDDKASLREVKLGVRKGAYVEVLEGLRDGDSVVIMGQQKLRDGAQVAAEE